MNRDVETILRIIIVVAASSVLALVIYFPMELLYSLLEFEFDAGRQYSYAYGLVLGFMYARFVHYRDLFK